MPSFNEITVCLAGASGEIRITGSVPTSEALAEALRLVRLLLGEPIRASEACKHPRVSQADEYTKKEETTPSDVWDPVSCTHAGAKVSFYPVSANFATRWCCSCGSLLFDSGTVYHPAAKPNATGYVYSYPPGLGKDNEVRHLEKSPELPKICTHAFPKWDERFRIWACDCGAVRQLDGTTWTFDAEK